MSQHYVIKLLLSAIQHTGLFTWSWSHTTNPPFLSMVLSETLLTDKFILLSRNNQEWLQPHHEVQSGQSGYPRSLEHHKVPAIFFILFSFGGGGGYSRHCAHEGRILHCISEFQNCFEMQTSIFQREVASVQEHAVTSYPSQH